MESTNVFVVEGAGTTVVHPLGLLMLLLCGTLLFSLPRRHALWAFIALTCLVSSRQCIAVFGINLYFARVMVLFFGTLRVLVRNELAGLRFSAVDWVMVVYAAWYLLAGALSWGLDSTDVKTRSGYLVEVLGMYLLMRAMIRDVADLRSAIACVAVAALPVAGFFFLEFLTARNVFAIFGGVPAVTATRDGRLRCQGAFAHPILAGVVWASLLPLLIYGVVNMPRHRPLMVTASLGAIWIVILTASSTPLLGLVVTPIGVLTYRWRSQARSWFVAAGVLLFVLHLCMKAPVWSLIQRIDLTSGNSGYHRYILVDGFIRHWYEWWLLGSTRGTAHWGHYTFDAANHYVAVGINAGVIGLGLFIALIALALMRSGRIGRQDSRLGWTLGVCIMVHCVCFIGISIWGQLHFAWNLPLAAIGSLSQSEVVAVGASAWWYAPPPRFALSWRHGS